MPGKWGGACRARPPLDPPMHPSRLNQILSLFEMTPSHFHDLCLCTSFDMMSLHWLQNSKSDIRQAPSGCKLCCVLWHCGYFVFPPDLSPSLYSTVWSWGLLKASIVKNYQRKSLNNSIKFTFSAWLIIKLLQRHIIGHCKSKYRETN